jgi:hypothetical protein
MPERLGNNFPVHTLVVSHFFVVSNQYTVLACNCPKILNIELHGLQILG